MTPRGDQRPFHILLIGASGAGRSKRLTNAWADATQAQASGCARATDFFEFETVEVIVIRTLTREAVCSTTINT
jgi:hypothetical protein